MTCCKYRGSARGRSKNWRLSSLTIPVNNETTCNAESKRSSAASEKKISLPDVRSTEADDSAAAFFGEFHT